MRLASPFAIVAALAVCACGGEGGDADEPPPDEPGCEPPNRVVGDACREPGVQDDGCPAGTLGLEDGSCRPAGIVEGECGEGFVHDGDLGCEPILPPEPCPDGTLAVPGESACHPVMDCGQGTWGNIPVDDTTQYVDQSFTGVSDGSATAPWTTIVAGISHAPTDGLVAIAAGSYDEYLTLNQSPKRLHGVCPDQVEIVGDGESLAAVTLWQAHGTELRGLSIRGDTVGVFVTGSTDVLFEHLHVRDTAGIGVVLQDDLGPTSVTLRASLFERNQGGGVATGSSTITIEDTLVRDGSYLAEGGFIGRGLRFVNAQDSDVPSTAVVRRSVIERAEGAGVYYGGAEGTVESLVIRDTVPAAPGEVGRGITLQDTYGTGFPSFVTIRGVLVERTVADGIYVGGSEATIEATVVRDTQPGGEHMNGRGITTGAGVSGGEPATVTVRNSLVEGSRFEGIAASGEVTIVSTAVRDTLFDEDGTGGRGITVMHDLVTGAPSFATLRASTVTGSHEVGVLLVDSEVTVEALAVTDTSPSPDGFFGDGMLGIRQGTVASFAVDATRIDNSARAGLGSFGAHFSLSNTAIGCATIPLVGELLFGAPFTIDDGGGNLCGCPGAAVVCKVVSAGLVPPTALDDT